MEKFLEKFPIWVGAIQDKKAKAQGYVFVKYGKIEYLAMFTEYDLAIRYLEKKKLFVGLLVMDAPKNVVSVLENLKAKKITHVGFNPKQDGRTDGLFPIDDVIEAAHNKMKEAKNGKNGKPS